MMVSAFGTPISVVSPIPSFVPTFPMTMEFMMRYQAIIPSMPTPYMVSIVISPMWIYSCIPRRDTFIYYPTRSILPRTIPDTLPWSPPPTTVEEELYFYLWNHINFCLR
jgi:hypothetical protein